MKPAKVRRKVELKTKEVDVNEAGEWLETLAQVQEIAIGRASTKENKRNHKSNYTPKKWFQNKKDARN